MNTTNVDTRANPLAMPLVLLADRSACLRAQVLDYMAQTAVGAAARKRAQADLAEVESQREVDPLVASLVTLQQPDGYWQHGDGHWRPGGYSLILTIMALSRLGWLGFDATFAPVASAAQWLFEQQLPDGSWPMPVATGDDEGASEAPMQTALPLRALASVGYAEDERCAAAYEWLLQRQLEDGAWPTGMARGDFRRVAGYRRLPQSRLGCRNNTTASLQCLALHPAHARSEAARQGLDHLLTRETKDRSAFGFDLSRLLGFAPVVGFISHFARFDPVSVLELCGAIGASTDDARVADLVDYALTLRNEEGLWLRPEVPGLERWLTLTTLRALQQIAEHSADADASWHSQRPRSPFKPTTPARY